MKLHGKQRKQERQQQAIERQKKHDSLTIAQKVENQMKTITLRTGSGTPKGTVKLVRVTTPTQKTSHKGNGKFTYQQGWDSSGNAYETKSRGGGWRQVKNN